MGAAALALAAALLLAAAPLPAAPGAAQGALAPEPTFRYAGRYEGEWVADLLELAPREGTALAGLSAQPGRLRGALTVEADCAGALAGHVWGQTTERLTFQLSAADAETTRTVQAAVDLVGQVDLAGTLSERVLRPRAGRVDAALEGTTLVVPREEDAVVVPAPLQGYYANDVTLPWRVATGAPGRLEGSWEGALDVAIDLPGGPPLRVRSAGRWAVERVAVELCPWRGEGTVRGTLPPVRQQEETLEFTFRPAGDGRLVGEGRGRATLAGGAAGGCQYGGGGPFAFRVVGEERAGRFRLRFEDDDQPQLSLTATCPSGRSVLPHYLLLSALLDIDLPQATGAEFAAEYGAPDGRRARLELRIRPLHGANPP